MTKSTGQRPNRSKSYARQCVTCGSDFVANRIDAQACSGPCGTAAWRARTGLSNKMQGPLPPCRACGVFFPASRIDAKYCSAACLQIVRREHLPECSVSGCTAAADAVGLCSMHQQRLGRFGSLDLPDVFCRDCGVGPLRRMPKGRPPTFCDACMARKNDEWSTNRRHIRRSLYATGDKITLPELGERDGWRCHLCGKKVRQRRGHDRLAPSIDHLIPVSAEGAHLWENVALAHKGCNSSRGNRGAAQLRLIA